MWQSGSCNLQVGVFIEMILNLVKTNLFINTSFKILEISTYLKTATAGMWKSIR